MVSELDGVPVVGKFGVTHRVDESFGTIGFNSSRSDGDPLPCDVFVEYTVSPVVSCLSGHDHKSHYF